MGTAKALRAAFALLTVLIATGPAVADTYYGFAAWATGGAGQPLYTITSCSNGTGLGTLRDAVSQGNRYIVSSVACSPPVDFGTSYVYVHSNTTIDFTTAPAPGYQYIGTLDADGPKCSPTCNNIVLKGLQCRRVSDSLPNQPRCISVERGAYNIVIDHNTFEKCPDDCLSVASNTASGFADSYNVTISRNLFNHPLRHCCADEAGSETTGLVDMRPRHVSFLLNLVYIAKRRNLWAKYDPSLNATDTTYDMRYNLLWQIGGESGRDGGPMLSDGVRANVYRNYFKAKDGLSANAQKRAIIACKSSGTASEDTGCSTGSPLALLYTAENVSHEGWSSHLNAKGNSTTPLSAGSVPTMTVCEAVNSVLADVGAPHKTTSDLAALASISIPSCAASTPAPAGR
jgi:hypothetical protein